MRTLSLPQKGQIKNFSEGTGATTASITLTLELIAVSVESDPYDLVVVGADPAGQTAAVQAASEGLATLLIEATAGGRVALDPALENRSELAKGSRVSVLKRTRAQAKERYVDSLISPQAVVDIKRLNALHCLQLDDGKVVTSRAVVVATGALYRKLDITNYQRFESRGIHYAATGLEAALCLGEELAVIGGGTSAGQAAVFLSGIAQHVHLLIRGDSLRAKMSSYLVQRILSSSHITLHTRTEVRSLEGDSELRTITWMDNESGQSQTRNMGNLFVMIGASANSGWLRGYVKLDATGFVIAGFTHSGCEYSKFATSASGVFAMGDVRSCYIRRVASASAETSAVVADVHRYLKVCRRIS